MIWARAFEIGYRPKRHLPTQIGDLAQAKNWFCKSQLGDSVPPHFRRKKFPRRKLGGRNNSPRNSTPQCISFQSTSVLGAF
jgi:hypothetical protein